jgi:hypothetical protein
VLFIFASLVLAVTPIQAAQIAPSSSAVSTRVLGLAMGCPPVPVSPDDPAISLHVTNLSTSVLYVDGLPVWLLVHLNVSDSKGNVLTPGYHKYKRTRSLAETIPQKVFPSDTNTLSDTLGGSTASAVLPLSYFGYGNATGSISVTATAAAYPWHDGIGLGLPRANAPNVATSNTCVVTVK